MMMMMAALMSGEFVHFIFACVLGLFSFFFFCSFFTCISITDRFCLLGTCTFASNLFGRRPSFFAFEISAVWFFSFFKLLLCVSACFSGGDGPDDFLLLFMAVGSEGGNIRRDIHVHKEGETVRCGCDGPSRASFIRGVVGRGGGGGGGGGMNATFVTPRPVYFFFVAPDFFIFLFFNSDGVWEQLQVLVTEPHASNVMVAAAGMEGRLSEAFLLFLLAVGGKCDVIDFMARRRSFLRPRLRLWNATTLAPCVSHFFLSDRGGGKGKRGRGEKGGALV
ncbi:zinc carboxypeptidase [Trypanosoma cruzi Dm28c]|uniref:Zinc carboxypeptidase n=1 Tax=Trypanosoma cruzi Dm28c TaxID=1416333 RepID=V5BDK1_TRYCR|nr:zinc carboxypeptidase [Trypanosoma cruzi Dm28c]